MSASHFKNKVPREYVEKLKKLLGPPTAVGLKSVVWENPPSPYVKIMVKDEYIPHDFPAPHRDFVYSTAKIKLTPKQAGKLLKVSGSIIPDLLKNEVKARCGGLGANDVTLSFAEDVAQGKAPATKAEYARRIKGRIVTRSKYNSYRKLEKELRKPDEECLLY